MGYRVTFHCNNCSTEYAIDNSMDLPPHWVAVQLAITNNEGLIPEHEQNLYMHFCTQKCFTAYSKSDELKERILMVDSLPPDDVDEDEESSGNDD